MDETVPTTAPDPGTDYDGALNEVEPFEEDDNTLEEEKSLEEVAREVLAGEWGTGVERRQALADAGYDPNDVKKTIVNLLNNKT